MQSEVRQLLLSIQAEYEAGRRALTDPAIVGKHAFIQARMHGMQRGYEHLQRLTSPERALEIVMQQFAGSDGRVLRQDERPEQDRPC